jgi:hypothetical protein
MKDNNKNYDNKCIEEMINLIIEILNVYQNALNSNKEIFGESSKDLLLKLEKSKNTYLTLSISIGGFIFGLSALDQIKNIMNEYSNWFIIVILVSLIVGVIWYIKMNYKIRRVSEELLKIEKEYYESYTTQNFLKGFFSRYVENFFSRDVEKSNKINKIRQLKLLDSFFLIVQGAIVFKIFATSIKELKNYNKPYEGFKPSDYSAKLFLLLTKYAYEEYEKLIKSQQFFPYSSITNDDLIEIFRDADRDKLLETVWNSKIKEFIEKYDYEELKKRLQKKD